MNLSSQILNELNDIDSLTSSELTAAEIVPYIPAGKVLKKTKVGVCDLCGYWDSDLKQGACDICNGRYGVKA